MRKADSVAIWTYEVARRLAGDHEVVVYGRRFPGQASSEVHEGVRYERVSVSKSLTSLQNLAGRLLKVSPVGGPASALYEFGYAAETARRLRYVRHDVVHVHNLSHFVPLLRVINPGVPVVLHMHCEWMSQINKRTAAERMESAARILGCSKHVAKRLEVRFPQFTERFGVLHNGVDLDSFGEQRVSTDPPPDGGVVIFVGRITPEKGVHDLLQAFELVLRKRPGAELRLIGPHEPTPVEYIVKLSREPYVKNLARFYPGNYLEQLKALVPREVIEHVRFVGEVDRTRLAEEYKNAHALANPSLSESFGMSLVEAMAACLPVVATRVGGMQNVIQEGKTGLLVPPADPASLGEALLTLLGDRDLRRRLVERGRQSVERRFSWETVATDAGLHYAQLEEAH